MLGVECALAPSISYINSALHIIDVTSTAVYPKKDIVNEKATNPIHKTESDHGAFYRSLCSSCIVKLLLCFSDKSMQPSAQQLVVSPFMNNYLQRLCHMELDILTNSTLIID